MVAYLKAIPEEKTYSDYLWAVREAEKEDSMEPSQSQTANEAAKPKVTSFFPLQKLKGTQPLVKTPAVCIGPSGRTEHWRGWGGKQQRPWWYQRCHGGVHGVCIGLVRAVKDAQKDEKCCYHCGSLDPLQPWLPISKNIKNRFEFKLQGGDGAKEGSPGPSDESNHANNAPRGSTQGIKQHTQTPFLNPNPF